MTLPIIPFIPFIGPPPSIYNERRVSPRLPRAQKDMNLGLEPSLKGCLSSPFIVMAPADSDRFFLSLKQI